MGISQEEGAKFITFSYKGEKQYWSGLLSTVLKEHPGCEIINVKDLN